MISNMHRRANENLCFNTNGSKMFYIANDYKVVYMLLSYLITSEMLILLPCKMRIKENLS